MTLLILGYWIQNPLHLSSPKLDPISMCDMGYGIGVILMLMLIMMPSVQLAVGCAMLIFHH